MGSTATSEHPAGRVEALARLRALVAYLGERDQHGWWPTSFLSATGRRFLAFNFPRTTLSAAVQAASRAAMRLHDERIGRQGAFHLFRLPHPIERDVHAQLAGRGAEAFAKLLESGDGALEALAVLTEQESGQAVGPVRVAGVARMLHRPAIRKAAALYRRAFIDATPAFPYYTRD